MHACRHGMRAQKREWGLRGLLRGLERVWSTPGSTPMGLEGCFWLSALKDLVRRLTRRLGPWFYVLLPQYLAGIGALGVVLALWKLKLWSVFAGGWSLSWSVGLTGSWRGALVLTVLPRWSTGGLLPGIDHIRGSAGSHEQGTDSPAEARPGARWIADSLCGIIAQQPQSSSCFEK